MILQAFELIQMTVRICKRVWIAEFRRDVNDAFHFNWVAENRRGFSAFDRVPMRNMAVCGSDSIRLHCGCELAANLRRAFSGICKRRDVKDRDWRIEEHGPLRKFPVRFKARIMQLPAGMNCLQAFTWLAPAWCGWLLGYVLVPSGHGG